MDRLINRVEHSGDPDFFPNAVEALEQAGVEFVAENEGGPGVRLRMKLPKSAEQI